MMTKREFENSGMGAKVAYIWQDGKHIANRIYKGQVICLYSIYGFFTEVYVDIGSDTIADVKVVNDEDRFKLYVEFIDLTSFINYN